MSYWHDEEAIYQDADIEMAEMTAAANRLARLEAKCICTHGSWVGLPASGEIYYDSQRDLVGDEVRCTHGCGRKFPNEDALMNERSALI